MAFSSDWAGLTDEPGPEDGTDPKDWHKKPWDGAKAAGWQAVLFQNAKTLEADLERFVRALANDWLSRGRRVPEASPVV